MKILTITIIVATSFLSGFFTSSLLTVNHASDSNSVTDLKNSSKKYPPRYIPEALDTVTKCVEEPIDRPFIKQTLSTYNFNLTTINAKQWQTFLELSAFDIFAEMYGNEALLYLAIVSGKVELVDRMIDRGADIDKKVRIVNYGYPLIYAAMHSSLSMFEKVAANSADLNAKPFKRIIEKINHSNQSEIDKRLKIEQLIANGYEISDLMRHVIPLVSYGDLYAEHYKGNLIDEMDPNKVERGQLLLTKVINSNASDQLVIDMLSRMNPNLEEEHKKYLLKAALRSEYIKDSNTIAALLSLGIDPNIEMANGTYSLSGQLLLDAMITKDEETYNTMLKKLNVLVKAGGLVTSERMSQQFLFEQLKAKEDLSDKRYDQLMSYIFPNGHPE